MSFKGSKKTVLIFLPKIYPHVIGGLEIFYFYVLNNLKDEANLRLAAVKNPKIKGVKFVSISSRLFLKIGGKKGSSLSLVVGLIWHLLFTKVKPDLIHLPATSSSGIFGKFIPKISRVFKIPYIIVNHGGGMIPWKDGDGNPELYRNAQSIFGVSSDICKELELRTERKVERLLPMIPYTSSGKKQHELRQKFQIPQDAFLYLMVGSLKPLKGNLYVLKEFLSLEEEWLKKKNKHILFVGKGVDAEEMHHIANSSLLANHIHFIKSIRNEEICALYGLADCFIMASDFEGTSKALLESMEKRLPIIATDVKGINNILEHRKSAVLFKKEPGELSNAIKEWDNKAEEFTNMAQQAFKIYDQEYHFRLTLDHLKQIYQL